VSFDKVSGFSLNYIVSFVNYNKRIMPIPVPAISSPVFPLTMCTVRSPGRPDTATYDPSNEDSGNGKTP
jgi:hypothetical protein